nr:hypothetical protein CFP56_20523 [Quercus suber]
MAAADSSVCYMISENYVTSSNQYLPCGNPSSAGGQSCCFAGDYCMQDNICYYTNPVVNGTGYYMAGCTDSTWGDPGCPQQCSKQADKHYMARTFTNARVTTASEFDGTIIYDTNNAHWDCCSSTEDSLNCQQPSDFIVNAPAPEQLILLRNLSTPVPSPALTTGIGAISATGAFSTASATTSKSQPSSTTKATPSSTATPQSTTTGLSGGTIAGIASSVILAIALLVVLVFLCRRRKSPHKRLPPPIARQHDDYNELNRGFAFPSPALSYPSTSGSTAMGSPPPKSYAFPSPTMMEISQQPEPSPPFTAHSPGPQHFPLHFPPPSSPGAPYESRGSFELPMSPRDELVARSQSPRARFNGHVTELEGDLARRGELPGSTPQRRPFSFEPAPLLSPRSPGSPGGSRLKGSGYFS